MESTKRSRFSIAFSSSLRQFYLLLWKNFILQIRRPIGTVFEVILPLLAILFLVGFRLGLFHAEEKCFEAFDSDPLVMPITFQRYSIYYAPNTSDNARALASIVSRMLSTSRGAMIGVSSQDEFTQTNNDSHICFNGSAGVYFDNLEGENISYTIRLPPGSWNTRSTYNPSQGVGARTSSTYFSRGFIQLEKVINEAIIEWKTGQRIDVNVTTRQFPYPRYHDDRFLRAVVTIFPLFVIISLIYSAGVFVKELVLEKESRIKETMKMMGLSNWILTATWYTKQLLFYLLPIIVMTLLLKFGRVFPESNVFLLFLFLLMFMISGIAFCFFISVWFSSARIGLMAGCILWFLAYMPFLFVSTFYDFMNTSSKVSLCLVSNVCVGLGIKVLSSLELRQEGLTFSNFAQPISVDDKFNMGWVILMLIIDTFLYMLLYWYIDAVKPGKYGVPKPYYFFLLPSYWCATRRKQSPLTTDETNALLRDNDTADSFEEEPLDKPIGINIEGLTKIYNRRNLKKRKLAVDNLSLKMYKGQVTVLLGRNGAGKTTTMSILTGLFPPTDGSAYINGLSVVDDIDLIRTNLGICPQHNVLFDRLTVSEHLSFFARLKGFPHKRVKPEVQALLEDLLLVDKRNIQSQKLSGGMKRKLSVGVALVGGSEIVILDEPTSGIDPYARRAIWDLIAKHKQGRTIMLTTHSMDEADLLGDRIGIMVEGQLHCSGSSLFLKSRYGVGYHMTIVKELSCDSSTVMSLVQQMVAGAKLNTDIGAELSFVLPFQSSHSFPELFDTIDDRKTDLGISSFGISATTMEEVFFKVASVADSSLLLNLQQSTLQQQYTSDETSEAIDVEKSEDDGLDIEVKPSLAVPTVNEFDETSDINPKYKFNTGAMLWFQQFYAMFIKRVLHSFRFWVAIIWQLIVPLTIILSGLILAKYASEFIESQQQPRLLSIHNSAPSKSNITFFWADFFSSNSDEFFRDDDKDVLGATNFFNYTDDILTIRNSITAHTTSKTCCNYQNQLLDKFCATRAKSDLNQCESVSGFGYSSCMDCLSCCTANNNPATCTNPLQRFITTSCPFPVTVSITDKLSGASGPLDDINVYVAEHLLNVSKSFQNFDFFRKFQGGYVLHHTGPTYSECGCKGNVDRSCRILGTKFYPLFPNIACSPVQNISCSVFNSSGSTGYDNYFFFEDYCMQKAACVDSECSANSEEVGLTSQPISPSFTPTITVWYNNQPYHMAPAVLNGFYQLYLKSIGSNVTITVYNNPLPRSLDEQITGAALLRNSLSFIVSFQATFGFSFLFSSFIIFLVQERYSKAKHLQFVSGVHATSYWLATYVWDIINALIPTLIVVILFAGFQIDGYKDENIGALFFLLVLSCWASIPVTYIMSFVFSNALIAFFIMLAIFYFISLFMQVAVTLVLFTSDVNSTAATTMDYFFLVHPVYALSSGLTSMHSNQNNREICKGNESICEEYNIKFTDNIFNFSSPGIGHVLLYMLFEGIFFFMLTILIERQFFIPELKRLEIFRKRKVDAVEFSEEDEDISNERIKVNSMTEYTDAVVIKNLVKEYKNATAILCPCRNEGRKLAVNGISLAIPTGECFGLLGVNGAGKTTVFKMLSGDITPTSGNAVLFGYDINTQLRLVQQRIGYCPQFDAFIDKLTGRELLAMFARLRGVPEKAIKRVVQKEISRLDLREYGNKKSGTYSGGNRRKLSTAIALVGNPPILLLDEPTTGMDPATRRFVWNVLMGIIKENRSVILTSHSMEECEALCTRLAIMVNGSFKCLGSIQHLKSKFGSGYTLQLKIQPLAAPSVYVSHNQHYDTTAIQQFITSTFPGSMLLEQHQGSVTYQVPDQGVSWSAIFRTVEQNKERFGIINYSVSQTTLDQVFINFAQEQQEDN